jgi:hypothetical protein
MCVLPGAHEAPTIYYCWRNSLLAQFTAGHSWRNSLLVKKRPCLSGGETADSQIKKPGFWPGFICSFTEL